MSNSGAGAIGLLQGLRDQLRAIANPLSNCCQLEQAVIPLKMIKIMFLLN
ncbi:hypothetical protein QUB52_02490 [Microcoleus sp. A6-C6]